MTTRHTITHADEVYTGDVKYEAYSPDGRRGLLSPQLFVKEFGAVETLDADGICVDATTTEAATLTPTGALVSGGTVTFTTPRAVSITSTSDNSGVTFTITGTDEYGETLVEEITGPNNTTANGTKAFLTVTGIATDDAITGNADVGSTDIFGLPVRIADKGDVISVSVDGVPESTLTVVAGLAATGTATATNGDVRGTVAPDTSSDGTVRFTALVVVGDNRTKTKVFGAAQYGG